MHLHRIKYKDIEQIPQIQLNKNFKQDFQGSAPAPFIGRFGYPNVNIGILSPQFSGETSHYDSPRLWSKGKFSISQIANMRYNLVNSRTTHNIKQLQNSRFLQICQEVGMSSKPVELEVNLQKAPSLNLKQETEIIPFGPGSEIKKARITANPKIDSRIECITSDTDLKATPGILNLYKKGFEENQLNKLISVGALGLKQNRKLVPTRWSITAVDDTIGKNLIQEIKQYPQNDYQLYFGGYFGNYYLILTFSEPWSYELFETYLNRQVNPWSKNGYAYSTDFEDYNGRTNYAEECAGGYYAARLPLLEKLNELKRQSSILTLRFITDEYHLPLGVWVCREAVRKSLQEKPLKFASEELMLKYAEQFIKNKFGFDLSLILAQSKLLKQKQQKKISDFA
ncbi:hypothetical protein HYX11_02680 [Candidatus Woesearchaeota archaeon]|nr:hypothetical protein [Candidatus Woesearchaeota archaeon]